MLKAHIPGIIKTAGLKNPEAYISNTESKGGIMGKR